MGRRGGGGSERIANIYFGGRLYLGIREHQFDFSDKNFTLSTAGIKSGKMLIDTASASKEGPPDFDNATGCYTIESLINKTKSWYGTCVRSSTASVTWAESLSSDMLTSI